MAAAITTLAALPAMIAITAVAANTSALYVSKERFQVAADSAAISGALTAACGLARSQTDVPNQCTDTGSVEARALQFSQGVCDTAVCVVSQPANDQAQVTITAQQPTPLLPFGPVTVAVSATAQVQRAAACDVSKPVAQCCAANQCTGVLIQ